MNDENVPTDLRTARVLVTGATGMQGGAAARALLRTGHRVTALVRNPAAAPARALMQQGAVLATGDLEDLASLEEAGVGQDVIFSVQAGGADPTDPAESRQARNIVTAAQQAGITQIIHTSVSATGWRTEHPEGHRIHPVMKEYWDQKEKAEDAVRRSGLPRWTIFKPAYYMENFLPPRRDHAFPDLSRGKLVGALKPQTVMALISAMDFGAAVAAAVAEPDRFHQAEIDLAGDALTFVEIAELLSQATGREIEPVFVSRRELEQRVGEPATDSQIWNDQVGYPARPEHAAAYGLTTTTFAQWATHQDWGTLKA